MQSDAEKGKPIDIKRTTSRDTFSLRSVLFHLYSTLITLLLETTI